MFLFYFIFLQNIAYFIHLFSVQVPLSILCSLLFCQSLGLELIFGLLLYQTRLSCRQNVPVLLARLSLLLGAQLGWIGS